MGWIHDRHMKQGGSIGGRSSRKTYPKDGAPLRRIVGFIRHQESIFSPALALLECGHQSPAWGAIRARCAKCKPPPVLTQEDER
jgi:hypothetical protein